jgi:hypothetical protein
MPPIDTSCSSSPYSTRQVELLQFEDDAVADESDENLRLSL